MMNNYLKHHGILGQKWGVRRFQNYDGSLTAEGQLHYKVHDVKGNAVRAVTNGNLGQRFSVVTNSGYRKDLKELKEDYKLIKKYQNDTLKDEYKRMKNKIKVEAADALYPWQTHATNKKVQTSELKKEAAKSFILGNYGSLNYNRFTANGMKKGKAITLSYLTEASNLALPMIISSNEYVYNRVSTDYNNPNPKQQRRSKNERHK